MSVLHFTERGAVFHQGIARQRWASIPKLEGMLYRIYDFALLFIMNGRTFSVNDILSMLDCAMSILGPSICFADNSMTVASVKPTGGSSNTAEKVAR